MLPGGAHSHGSERGVRLALVQSACSEDEASNLERTVGAIEAAARDARDPSSVPVGRAFQAVIRYLEAVEDGQAP